MKTLFDVFYMGFKYRKITRTNILKLE